MKYLLAVLLTIAALPRIAAAQTPPPKPARSAFAGRIADTFGDTGRKTGREPFAPLRTGDVLPRQSTIRTGDNAAVLIAYPGETYLRLGANSVLVLDGRGTAKLLSGQLWASTSKTGMPAGWHIATPSAVTDTSEAKNNYGIGYDLETDQTVVSVGKGAVSVALKGGGWRGTATAGQFVQYLRSPQPNIRLRRPEIAAQPASHKAMWKRLQAERWTDQRPTAKLTRGIEGDIGQVLTRGVFGGEGNKL